MRFNSIPFDQVDAGLLQNWVHLQSLTEDLASPFFSPEFAEIVAQCRDDLWIGVIEENDVVSGILPFHRKSGGRAAPLAGQYCDYQGVIGTPPDPGVVAKMLRGFGISCYDFNHALAAQPLFNDNAFWQSTSPRADLRRGYEAWVSDVSAQTKTLKSLARKERKIAREIGALTFVEHDTNVESWQLFKDWKNAALRQMGLSGFPGPAWALHMIDTIRGTQTASFGGCFSTLYAGDRLVAAHFGMRTADAWHWWFPSYDADLGRYSPGMMLLRYCIETAAQSGFKELDFGRGTERYKKEFSNGARTLCEGSLERASVLGITRQGRKTAQRVANRILNERSADILRRGSTKILRAGLI